MFKFTRFSWNYGDTNPYPDYNDYIKYVDSKLLTLGFEKEIIGKSQDGEFNIYGYSKNLDKPIFWLDADIHGSEWQSSYYTLDWVHQVWGDTFIDKKVTKYIRDNLGIYFSPSINPWGYHNVEYQQVNGVNLARNFDSYWESYKGNAQFEGHNYKGTSPESESEAKAVATKIRELKPYIAINCHTTTGPASGVDMSRRFSWYSILFQDVQNSLKITYPEIGTLDWNAQFSPTAQGWYGQQISREGTPTFANIIEHQSDRDDVNTGLATLYIIVLTILNFKNNGKLKLNNLNDIF